jgi:hypothetical protein
LHLIYLRIERFINLNINDHILYCFLLIQQIMLVLDLHNQFVYDRNEVQNLIYSYHLFQLILIVMDKIFEEFG